MKIVKGDITTVSEGIIVQQVNAQGVMKSGVAKAIREKYPAVWDDYSAVVKPNQHDKGLQYLGKVIYTYEPYIIIASIIGQQYYGRDNKLYTSYEALNTAFKEIGDTVRDACEVINVPLIGCGLGGGDWDIVKEIIESNTYGIDVNVWVQSI